LNIKEDASGPEIHSDQYGRPAVFKGVLAWAMQISWIYFSAVVFMVYQINWKELL